MPKKKKEKAPKARLSNYLDKKADGRKNTYVFKGYYDRLTAISAKQGLNSVKQATQLQEEEATRYLMGFGSYDVEDQNRLFLNSNFIALLNSRYTSLKINPSIEFKALHSSLQQYTSSYNLMLLKKDEIIDRLVETIEVKNGR